MDELNKLSYCLGHSLSKELYDDGNKMRGKYKDVQDFTEQRPSPLIAFLEGATSTSFSDGMSHKKR